MGEPLETVFRTKLEKSLGYPGHVVYPPQTGGREIILKVAKRFKTG